MLYPLNSKCVTLGWNTSDTIYATAHTHAQRLPNHSSFSAGQVQLERRLAGKDRQQQ